MEFYKTVFGGELTLQKYGDGPDEAHADPKANSQEVKEKIMHARLEGNVTILASDNPHHQSAINTGQFSLSIEGADETLNDYFNHLAENGEVQAPLIKQFWGDTFGMVKDKYGINWMITIK